ncbi:hypothetical protein C8A01DRAFT_41605 [Parachaetomium inaequale]|uniref:Uncharacterized protein n=1 Tax=Parachaetomium inaequale TaxID=2588326 RepID=A0AAN6P5G2_9PEZI|nr:hypothetical protein C8A01DRAFT_41605 [Parachaetomium inaequale]
MSQTDSRSPTSQASLPAIVIKANKFHVDTITPCRFNFVIPLELPSILDPSIPPPPYYPPNIIDRQELRDPTTTALRPAVTGALYQLLGTAAPVSTMVPTNNLDWRQRDEYVSRLVTDRSKFDPVSGHWTDQYGVEGFETKAYIDYGGYGGIEIVEAYQIRVDQNIEDNKSNPMAVEVKAMPVLHEGKVAFVARRFREGEQEAFNQSIWEDEW